MKIKLWAEHSEVELEKLYCSNLYQEVQKKRDYELCNQYYSEYFGEKFLNFSLVIYKNDVPTILVYAFSDGAQFSYFGGPIQIFEIDKLTNEEKATAYLALYQFLKIYLKKNNFSKIIIKGSSYLTSFYYDRIQSVLCEYDAFVDLTLPTELLKRYIRKRYRSFVNWGERELDCRVLDSSTITQKHFEDFKKFHLHVAAKKTRTDKSWLLQLDTVRAGSAYLIMSYFNEELVAANYVEHGSEEALYCVGVYDRDLMSNKLAISHYPMMLAINHAKGLGLRRFNLGGINIDDMADDKMVNIFKFKKGFATQVENSNVLTVAL